MGPFVISFDHVKEGMPHVKTKIINYLKEIYT